MIGRPEADPRAARWAALAGAWTLIAVLGWCVAAVIVLPWVLR